MIGLMMSLSRKCLSIQSSFAPLLCLLSVVANCTVIGLSVYFFNTFIVAELNCKVAYAALAAIASMNSTMLAFAVFQAQKFERCERRNLKLEKQRLKSIASEKQDLLDLLDVPPKSKPFYHSLIALNVHQYMTEQIAIIDPSVDMSFIKRNRIVRLQNPYVVSQIKKSKKSLPEVCV